MDTSTEKIISKLTFVNGKLYYLDGTLVNGINIWDGDDLESICRSVEGNIKIPIQCFQGDKWWCVDGNLHRLDGPAVECESGIREWWVDGVEQNFEKV